MNHRKNETLTKTQLEPFLKIAEYEKAEQLDAAGWTRALQFRYAVKGYRDLVFCLLANPIPKTEYEGSLSARSALCRVWDRQVFDAYFDRDILELDELRDALDACKAHEQAMNTEEMAIRGDEILYRSLDDLCREREVGMSVEQVIYVDMYATDEQLIGDFKKWLKRKRLETGGELSKKNFTDKDFADWANYKVLAYIDLEILCSHLNKRASLATIGDLLFPNDDVDRAERVRKVVQPLARKLMNPVIFNALDVQAGHAEREKANPVPGQ